MTTNVTSPALFAIGTVTHPDFVRYRAGARLDRADQRRRRQWRAGGGWGTHFLWTQPL